MAKAGLTGGSELVGADDVRAAVGAVTDMLSAAPRSAPPWQRRAGQLRWPCRNTLAHVVDCLNWYAANLARRSTSDVESPDVAPTVKPRRLVDGLGSAGAILAATVTAAGPDDRGWHPFGIADRSGFAAMGCDEVLVHGFDLAAGLGRPGRPLPFDAPADLAGRVVRRLFPWAPSDADPWSTLLWANGRVALGDRPPETRWLWHCAPLAEWGGRIRRMRPAPPPS
jgi:hypothetical protein